MLPAQDLTVSRSTFGSNEGTQYDISSAAPQQLSALPRKFGVKARVALIVVPRSKTGQDPTRLGPRHVRIWDVEEETTDWLSVTVNGALRIRASGPEPVAAVSPPLNRWTTIDYADTEGPSDDQTLRVTTEFNPEAADRSDDVNAIPVMDVVGPKTVLWGPTQGVRFPAQWNAWAKPLPGTPGRSFDAPVATWAPPPPPRAPRGWVPEVVVAVRRPVFAARIAVRPTTLRGRGSSDADLSTARGSVTIEAPRVGTHAAELVSKFALADRHPVFWLRGIPTIPDDEQATIRPTGKGPGEASYGRTDEQVEYPPTPPTKGINVFGEMSDLRFSEATADVSFAKHDRALRALTPLDFRNIRGGGVVGHHMIVPVRVDGPAARINVIGNADTRINGEPVATARPWLARQLSRDSVSWFLGLVGAFSFAQGVRLRIGTAPAKKRRARAR
ncbi:MAG: hypothetical protein QOH76_3952 [Thermoleophilaceae bacterium]|nr:hypothetical protein [Thermoleophilaceae bacterium]